MSDEYEDCTKGSAIADMLREARATATAKKWPLYGHVGEHDRATTVGASEIGRCERRAGFDKHPEWGHEKDPSGSDAAYDTRGNLIERWVMASLRTQITGREALLHAAPNQRTFLHPAYPISATPDGLYQGWTDAPVTYLEVKTIDPRTRRANLPKAEHLVQAQVGMEVVAAASSYEVSEARLVYLDASSLEVVRDLRVPRLEGGIPEGYIERANAILDAEEFIMLRPDGAMVGECRWCPWKGTCQPFANFSRNEQEAADLDAILAPLVLRFVELKKAADEADALNAQIKQVMAQHGSTRFDADGVVATLTSRDGQKRMNKAKVEAVCLKAGVKYEDVCTVTAASVVLKVDEA